MTKKVSCSSIRGACQLPSDAGVASVLRTRMATFFIGREVGCGPSQQVSEENLGIEAPAGAQRFLWRIPIKYIFPVSILAIRRSLICTATTTISAIF
ncbi:hypothetical protein soil367_11480 [Hydrocarboniclastica marina]|uniref:Uncharacterized protein n=1 Tax=Hydrocarboniclastica marina TaxID=2259620 RepID=A0A4P7XHJ2_9ALTE|nr:hypothetical protein soil367_11480 [Hydrocarboniclastica marina]